MMNDVADKGLFNQVLEIVKVIRAQEREDPARPATFTPTPEQARAILQVADFWIGWQFVGRMAIWGQRTIKVVGTLATAYFADRAWAAGLIKSPW